MTNEKAKTGLEILQAAIFIGIAGDFLLRETPWGLNAFLWVSFVAAAFLALTYLRKREYFNRRILILNGVLLFFASTFLYRASIPLLMLNVAAIFVIWAILTLPNLKIVPQIAGVSHYILGFVWSGINLLVAPLLLIFSDVKWKGSNDSRWAKTVFPIIRGLLFAAPLLIIFGGLFMAADAAFEGLIKRTLNLDTGKIFSHLFLTVFLSWIVAGYLRGTLVGSLIPEYFAKNRGGEEKTSGDEKTFKRDWREFDSSWLPDALTLGKIEVGVIWGLMNFLFLSFVLVQLPYLFGGFEYVQNTENVKLAEYARRGVAELGLVTVLVLPVLLAGHWFIRRANKGVEKLFKAMAGVQIGLLFVIMISSAQRMILYTGSYGYGLTLERFYAMVLLAVLAIVFVWFAATIFTGRRGRFAWGMLWICLFALGTLNILNPSKFVLQTNYKLMQEGRKFDAFYNFSELADDASPTLFEILPSLGARQKCDAENGLVRIDYNLKPGVRLKNWNYARRQTANLLESYKQQIGVQEIRTKNCYALFPEPDTIR